MKTDQAAADAYFEKRVEKCIQHQMRVGVANLRLSRKEMRAKQKQARELSRQMAKLFSFMFNRDGSIKDEFVMEICALEKKDGQ